MEWTTEQQKALKEVAKWLADPSAPQIYRLFGFAGTGKTTLARHLLADLDGKTCVAAYTGKAAQVLTRKGLPAQTLHSLIYVPKERGRQTLRALEEQMVVLMQELSIDFKCSVDDPRVMNHRRMNDLRFKLAQEQKSAGRPLFDLKPDSNLIGARVLLVDECSMVDEVMGADICSFGVKVLALGDPFQLPPVAGGGFFTEHEPDLMLTDVQRAAKDNPVVRICTDLRDRKMPRYGTYGGTVVMDKSKVSPDIVLSADQVLVGRNATRRAYNKRIRALHGRTGLEPVQGDRLVCLRNNAELGLINGSIWDVEQVGVKEDDKVAMTIIDDEGVPRAVLAHTHYFEGRHEELKWYEKKDAEEFDYGNVLSVHKAQGSQWDNVLVFDESESFRAMRYRHLYTAASRTAQDLTLVMGM